MLFLIGATIKPLIFSCFFHSSGIFSAEAEAKILSNGASEI